jgi:IclR family pca regulon transcriptional regulator
MNKNPRQMGGQSPLIVKSVEKAFMVLGAFDGDRTHLTLAELARILGTDKSTAQRFTYTLEHLGYLEKDAVRKAYALSSKNLNSAHAYMKGSRIISAAMPFIQHIHRETGETVNLSVLEGTTVRFVMRLPGNHILSTDVVIGSKLPAYCTASGMAILSFLDDGEARSILSASEIRKYTPDTSTDLEEIMSERINVRQRGYALNYSGYFHDDISVAAPVLRTDGYPIAAISVGVASARFSLENAEARFAPYLLAATRAISIN